MPNSTNLSFLGIAKETTPGTGVAPTAYIPVTGPQGKDALTLLPDKGMRGALVETYDEISGVKSGTFDFGGDVFPDTFPWLLAGILGDVATTGASAPFTHSMAVLNTGSGQPPSYTLTDYYAVAARAYPGAKLSEVGLKFSGDTMLTYSAKAVTFGSVPATKPTSSFTAIPPLAGWVGTVKIGGVAVSVVLDGEVNLKRSVTPIFPVNGSQAPSQLWAGALTVDGKLTVVMEDEAYLNAYLNNTSTALEINYQAGAGATAVQVKLTMSKVKYNAADIDRGKDYVTLGITFEGLANTTDIGVSAGYSPVKATIQNAVTTGVYA